MERRKEEERQKKYKNRNPTSQFQTTITFDRKVQLEHVTRPQKAYDEIYMVNHYRHYGHFRAKKHHFDPKKRI
jgi:hypothetical protein